MDSATRPPKVIHIRSNNYNKINTNEIKHSQIVEIF